MTCAGTVPAALVVLVAGDGLVVDDVEAVVEVEVEVEVEVDDPVVTGDELMVVVGIVDGVGEDPPHEVTAISATHATRRLLVMTLCGIDDMFRCHHLPG